MKFLLMLDGPKSLRMLTFFCSCLLPWLTVTSKNQICDIMHRLLGEILPCRAARYPAACGSAILRLAHIYQYVAFPYIVFTEEFKLRAFHTQIIRYLH